MRTLSSTLEAVQKASSGILYLRIVVGSETFGVERVLRLDHEEQPHRETATIILDNSDGYLTAKNLRGNEVAIGLGFRTSNGNEYSNGFPLRVISQSFQSAPNKLTCELNCVGVANELTEDRADERYVPTTETIQTLTSGILEGTLTPFDQCPAYTVSYGTLDGLIDTVKPADSFRIYVNSSRLAALRRLLDFTYCVMRPEDDGEIHIFKPVITGETYDYEYALNAHVFYAKTQSNTITIPNHIIVRTPVDASPAYSGEATDAESIAAYKTIKYYEIVAGLTSNAQAQSIAEAILSKFQMHDVMAGATVPINVGAEIYDYVKITDAREGTTVTGNIGYIRTLYQAGTPKQPASYTQTFGLGGWLSTRRREIESEVGGLPGEGSQYQAEMVVDTLYLNPINLDWIEDGTNFSRVQSGALSAEGLVLLDEVEDEGGTYARTLATQLSAGKLLLSDECEYTSGYDPSTKWEGSNLDHLPDGTSFKRVASAALSAGGLVLLDQIQIGTTYDLVYKADISAHHLKLSSVEQSPSARYTSDGEKGTWNSKANGDLSNVSYNYRVRETEISAGHIKLTSQAVVDGQWYNEGGVIIDANAGISVAGGDVLIDTNGITVTGERLLFKYGATNVAAVLGQSWGLNLHSYPHGGTVNLGWELSNGSQRNLYAYGGSFYASPSSVISLGSNFFYFEKLWVDNIDVGSGGQIVGPAGAGSRHGTATYYPEQTHSDEWVLHCNIPAFSKLDDVALLRSIQERDGKLDTETFPDIICVTPDMEVENKVIEARCEGKSQKEQDAIRQEAQEKLSRKAIGMSSWQSLTMGAVLQLAKRVELLEER